MKLNLKLYSLILLLSFSLYNCSKSEEQLPLNVEIQDFVWKGMNAYYLWQSQIPDLADTRFNSQSQLNSYLQGFSSPNDIFQSLLYQPGVVDRFSWIVDDYIALENSFQGIAVTNGMEFGLVRYATNSTNVFGYVRYVIPNSDADILGITRGMIFNTVDGNQLTDSNFNTLLAPNNYTIGLADYNNGDPVANNTSFNLSKSQIAENPILVNKVINEGANRIGYLMYNQFASSYDDELNAVFADFRNQNITDLIIDLRYNGGGSVRTATYLGSMVAGLATSEVFSRQVWNQKVQDAISADNFINNFADRIDHSGLNETINSVNLTNVYFIVSDRSASASELLINALMAHINVRVVGETTFGKPVGSVTLYDSDNLTRTGANLNPNHTWAIQPIVLEIVNKDGTNFPNGIPPNISLEEDYGDLGVLGERSDPLLDRTIVYILTGSKGVSSSKKKPFTLEQIGDSKMKQPSYNNMYVEIK